MVQFGVLYEHRASDHLKRIDVINTIVDCISQVSSSWCMTLTLWQSNKILPLSGCARGSVA